MNLNFNINYNLKDNFYYLLILFISLFSSSYIFFKSPFEFYFYYIIVLFLLPIFLFKYGIPKFIISIFSFLFFLGLIHVISNNNLPFTFFKVYGGLLLLVLFYFYIIRHVGFDIKYLFYWYCKFCIVLCFLGLIQVVSFYLNFEYGYNFSWFLNKWGLVQGGLIGIRVNSIISEPTYLATVLSPALFVSFKNLISRSNIIFSKTQSFLVIMIVILTTSTIGYLGILISFLLSTNSIRLRFILFGFIVSFFGISLAYNNVTDFKNRIDAATGLWVDENFNINNTNNSSFVLYNNIHVAKENLSDYPFFGTGLGSHETAFKKYTLTKSLIQYDFEFNIKDGNSLFVRLCTETGLVGLGFILLLLVKGFIYKVNNDNKDLFYHHLISQSIFVLLVLVLIRQGNYMLNGLPLLFLMYFYNYIQYNDKLNNIGPKNQI
jgi:hypothetical protein